MDNNHINTIVRSLYKLATNPDVYQDNDMVVIKYQISNLGVMMIKTTINDWEIIQERIKVRRECTDFNQMKHIVDQLNSCFGSNNVITQLKSQLDSTSTTLIDNQTATKLKIQPKILLEAAIDIRDFRLSLDYHCDTKEDTFLESLIQ